MSVKFVAPVKDAVNQLKRGLMQEFRDGTFGPVSPASEFFEKMVNQSIEEWDQTRAIHFGTEQELEEIKEKKSIEQRVFKLEQAVEDLKPVESDMILIPTKAQIKRFAKRFS
jgi:hypothetical protein